MSRELVDAVQQAMRDRAPAVRKPGRVGSKFLLSGLLKCGVCGRPYTGQGAKSGQFAYYICGTLYREGAGACEARYLNAPRVEDFVVEMKQCCVRCGIHGSGKIWCVVGGTGKRVAPADDQAPAGHPRCGTSPPAPGQICMRRPVPRCPGVRDSPVACVRGTEPRTYRRHRRWEHRPRIARRKSCSRRSRRTGRQSTFNVAKDSSMSGRPSSDSRIHAVSPANSISELGDGFTSGPPAVGVGALVPGDSPVAVGSVGCSLSSHAATTNIRMASSPPMTPSLRTPDRSLNPNSLL